MKIGIILGIFIALSGCTALEQRGLKPYGYFYLQEPLEADYWLHPDRSWQCNPPWVTLGVGAEHRSGVRIGVHHLSTVPCGGPFNNKAEVHYSSIAIGGDWGGWSGGR